MRYVNEIIVDTKTAEKRFAVKEGGLVTKLFVEQPGDRSEIGNIYIGRVESVKQGMNAAFINIGKDKNGFLQRDQLPSFIHSSAPNKSQMAMSSFIREGDKILVQVKKDETATKGPLLTAVLEFAGERTIYMPEGKYISVSKKGEEPLRDKWRKLAHQHQQTREGFIIRTNAFSGTEQEWLNEVEQLRKDFQSIEKRERGVKAPALLLENSRLDEELNREMVRLHGGHIYCNDRIVQERLEKSVKPGMQDKWAFSLHQKPENIFSAHNLDADLTQVQKQIVSLDNGAYIVINETEAAVVVDVNTGKFTGKQAAADTIVKTNIAAAKEIARQLRLRDYGGMILIDFIDMVSSIDKRKVQRTLENELKKDPKQTRVLGFTPLGIFEVTRKRTMESLPATLQTWCRVCGGTGKVESPETAAFRLERELFDLSNRDYEAVLIECDKATRNAFAGENHQHLSRFEELLHMRIFFKMIDFGKFEYHIRQLGAVEEIQSRIKEE